MKKVICVFVLGVVLLLCLYACSQKEVKAGSVKILADGQEYAPLSNLIFSLKDGLAADAERKQPAAIENELTVISVKDDISVLIEGETPGVYTLFNEELKELYYRSDHFEVPAESGVFICSIEVTWGDETEYKGYQYFFKFAK